MQSPNYFFGIVKILEDPKQKTFNNKCIIRALITPIRKNKLPNVISLVFWGTFASDIKNYYRMNDYILVEGYISIKNKNNKTKKVSFRDLKKVQITVLKAYPFFFK